MNANETFHNFSLLGYPMNASYEWDDVNAVSLKREGDKESVQESPTRRVSKDEASCKKWPSQT